MAHDHHFLSRLDRVDWRQAETALHLYRDRELVLQLLRWSSAPREAERIAISLGDPKRGPFVIVHQSGRFVTCLGEGMRVQHHVIERRELDRIWEYLKAKRLAAGDERAEEAAFTALGRAFKQPHRFNATDIATLRPVAALFERVVWQITVKGAKALASTLDVTIGATGRRRRKMLTGSNAHIFYSATLLHRNALVILGLDTQRYAIHSCLKGFVPSLSGVVLELGHMVFAAGWSAAQAGIDVFDAYASAARNTGRLRCLNGVLGLCCIAARHPEVLPAAIDELEQVERQRSAGDRLVILLGLTALREEQGCRHDGTLSPYLRRYLFDEDSFPGPGPLAPRELTATERLSWLANYPENVLRGGMALGDLLPVAMGIARLEAEQLYLPEQLATAHAHQYSRERVRKIMMRIGQGKDAHKPTVNSLTVGRNDPCPCGSGRKFKRCCVDRDVAWKMAG